MTDCFCARAGFPGSCDNCDANSGPIKFWRDQATFAQEHLEEVARVLRNREDPDWKVLSAARKIIFPEPAPYPTRMEDEE